ncbi:MAG: LytR/AlgR family response regulator transcription factor, partial [Chitinophagaceae bacterium]
ISCESEGNYTHLFLKDKRKIIASRNLKEIEELLEDYPFIRIHHSHIVNINEVEKYIKGEGGYLIMSDGSTINVSRSRKEFLLKKISLK